MQNRKEAPSFDGRNGLEEINGDFHGKDIISLDQFDLPSIEKLIDAVGEIKTMSDPDRSKLLDYVFVTLFMLEPSTRTRFSFEAAVIQSGGKPQVITAEMFSNIPTDVILDNYVRYYGIDSDVIVIRHPQVGSANRAAQATNAIVINGGDGIGEHPTQALTDLYTIRAHHGRLDNLTGVLTGDMLNGRTVHSLIKGLSLYPGTSLYLLSEEGLGLSRNDFNQFSDKVKLYEIGDKSEIPPNADFWYWTRVQKERFTNEEEYQRINNRFVVDKKLLKERGSKNMILMHPLPRVGEILPEVDSDPRAVYFEQAENGMYVRMALLSLVLGKIK